MNECAVCKEQLTVEDFVVCTGCDGGLHFRCSGISRATWKAKGAAKKVVWRCKSCRRAARMRRGMSSSARSCSGQDLTTTTTSVGHDQNDTGNIPLSHTPDFHVTLAALRSRVRIVPRIPKGARILVAEQLTRTVLAAINKNDEASWQRLFLFSFSVLARRDERKISLTTQIKNNLSAFENMDSPAFPPTTSFNATRRPASTSKRAQAKLSDGDVRGAVRLLCSEDDIAPFSPETLEALRKKHPTGRQDASFPDPPQSTHLLQPTTDSEIQEAVRSFSPGSAGGLDGLRPQHLKDLLTSANGDAATKLTRALAELVDLMLDGRVPESVCLYLYGATLTALTKKDGGIRPIAVGNTIRRLAAKIGCRRAQSEIGTELRPHQLGFGTPGGAEAAVHATRRFVEEPGPPRVLIKLDFINAFNSMYRDHMLSSVQYGAPSLYPLSWQCYRRPSVLSFGDGWLESADGCQQGDPIGPLLFCVGLQPLCRVLRSHLNVWYLDDGTLGGPLNLAIEDIKSIQAFSESSGLVLNPRKCEVFFIGHTPDEEASALKTLEELLPGIRHTQRPDLCLLGAPLTDEATPVVLQEKRAATTRMGVRLEGWCAHNALFVLKNCLAVPKLVYTIRTCPAWRFSEELCAIDESIRSILQKICNTTIEGATWCQASLPVGKGGLGIRRIEELAIPAFLASSYSTAPLVADILHVSHVRAGSAEVVDTAVAEAEDIWRDESESISGARMEIPPLNQRSVQKRWDNPLTDQRLRNIINDALRASQLAIAQDPDPKSEHRQLALANIARLLAAATRESGLWLQVLPSPSLGTYLDNDAIRVAVALRLGAPICAAHVCRCGAHVDTLGRHGLSCRLSAGRHPRHHALNDVVRRALGSAGVPSRLEPTGLTHDEGLRADGLSMVPWSGGRSLTWDATCVDTFAMSHLASTSMAPGAAANRAEEMKREKYLPLANRFIFAPLGFETTGTFGDSSSALVREIGRRITAMTSEVRATKFLRQRLSVEIQRGNSLAIFGTFPPYKSFEELFLLA